MAGENLSRTELLQWVNATCNLAVSRIEDLGNGIAYCVIIDSIFEDVPLKKLKWNANQEVDYLANFRILQTAFQKYKIDKPIPVEKLVKLTLAPNLEFLQFLRRYWVSWYPEGKLYDAAGRRNATGIVDAPLSSSSSNMLGRTTSASSVHTVVNHEIESAPRPPVAKVAPKVVGARAGLPVASKVGGGEVAKLKEENAQLKNMVDAALNERDFYFGKLREVEILMQTKQQLLESGTEMSEDLKEMLKSMEAVLYATTEGFELPMNEGEAQTA